MKRKVYRGTERYCGVPWLYRKPLKDTVVVHKKHKYHWQLCVNLLPTLKKKQQKAGTTPPRIFFPHSATFKIPPNLWHVTELHFHYLYIYLFTLQLIQHPALTEGRRKRRKRQFSQGQSTNNVFLKRKHIVFLVSTLSTFGIKWYFPQLWAKLPTKVSHQALQSLEISRPFTWQTHHG